MKIQHLGKRISAAHERKSMPEMCRFGTPSNRLSKIGKHPRRVNMNAREDTKQTSKSTVRVPEIETQREKDETWGNEESPQ